MALWVFGRVEAMEQFTGLYILGARLHLGDDMYLTLVCI